MTRNFTRKLFLNSEGMVLITALLILSLLTILSMAAIMYTNINSKITRNYKLYQQMFYENEGVTELVPGLLRRTIALHTESPAMLISMGIADTDSDGVSDGDETALPNIAPAAFVNTIMGYPPLASYNLVVTINAADTTLNLDRGDPFTIPGFSTGFGTGYHGGNITGKAVNYTSKAVKLGSESTYSSITTVYQCTERGGGGCL